MAQNDQKMTKIWPKVVKMAKTPKRLKGLKFEKNVSGHF